MAAVDNLEALLARGQDNALLRFSLGNEYLKLGDAERAVIHLRAAVRSDPEYSAAWKALGKALNERGVPHEAIDAYRVGIAVAEKKGDKQAAKEMQVFKRRLEQSLFKPQ
jgi:Tfp pilus assembly protein PilF